MNLPEQILTVAKNGTRLDGLIVDATKRYISVKLISSLEGDSHVSSSYFSARSGMFPLTKDGAQISESGMTR